MNQLRRFGRWFVNEGGGPFDPLPAATFYLILVGVTLVLALAMAITLLVDNV